MQHLLGDQQSVTIFIQYVCSGFIIITECTIISGESLNTEDSISNNINNVMCSFPVNICHKLDWYSSSATHSTRDPEII